MNSTTLLLLVEDEAHSVFFFEHITQKLEIPNPLRVAKNGQEALDYFNGVGSFADRQQNPLPGLVFLDLRMPHVTGFEVLRQIRANPVWRAIVVIILTSSASHADIANAYELGANAYLVKPLELEELEALIKAVRDFWLIQNQFNNPKF
jgi:CheY-like chemotaxis protein